MDPKTTALVLIEYQNDFTSPGGTLHEAVKPVMESTNMLANTKDAAEKVRAAGGTVEDLAPQPSDIVVEGKRGLDAFASTNLDFILRSRGITTIALGGFLTNCCVESTMRTAYEKGYNVITLKDCTATVSEEEQRLATEKNYPMFSRPMDHAEFISQLESKPLSASRN